MPSKTEPEDPDRGQKGKAPAPDKKTTEGDNALVRKAQKFGPTARWSRPKSPRLVLRGRAPKRSGLIAPSIRIQGRKQSRKEGLQDLLAFQERHGVAKPARREDAPDEPRIEGEE